MGAQLKSVPECRLVPLSGEHAEAMSAWMSNPELPEALGVHAEPSLERTQAWIEKAASDASIAAFAVLERDRHVGNVVLDQIDAPLKIARLSVYIGEAADRGAGIGTAAVRLALARAFGELGLHKVWLTVHVRNASAIAVYTEVGFTVEGVLRGEFLINGERVDALRMAIESDALAGA